MAATTVKGILGAGLVGVIAALSFGACSNSDADAFGGRVDADAIQSVILSNDKVYFGRLRDLEGDYYELRDAHFIREQPAAAGGGAGGAPSAPTREVVPIAEELHKPQRHILLRKSDVVIVENLERDSSVSEAIRTD